MGFETESTREPEDSMSMETGQDMGGRVEAAAAMYPQHEKYCLTFGCGKLKGHDGDHSSGPLNKLVANQQVKNHLTDPFVDHLVAETLGGTGRTASISGGQAGGGAGPWHCPVKGCTLPPGHGHGGGMGAWVSMKAVDISQQPEVMIGSDAGDALVLDIRNIPNEQARRVLTNVLPGLLELYLKKSKDYGGDVGAMIGLGPKAHFVDMWRKMGKLKRALWDGVELEGEKPEEIMRDLVGHIFIILDSG